MRALSISLLLITGCVRAATVTGTTVDLPSGKVFYRDSLGSGVPVVFLHAGSGNSMLWEFQIPAFIAAGYRFIAADHRGVGPASVGELLDKLGIAKFHLLGTAAGGGVALQYALAQPGRLRSLTVANSIGNVRDEEYVALGRRLRPAPWFGQLPLEFRELGPSYRAANPEGVKRWLALSERETATPAPSPAAIEVTWAKLEALTVPTLLLTGDADLYTPPAVLRMFAAHMKQARFAVIPEAGHSAYWENPEAFNRAVLAFLRRHR